MVNVYRAIEHGHSNSEFSPLKMVDLSSSFFVHVDQRVQQGWVLRGWVGNYPLQLQRFQVKMICFQSHVWAPNHSVTMPHLV